MDFVSILEETPRAAAGTDSAVLVDIAVVTTSKVAEVCAAAVRGLRATQVDTAGHEGRAGHLLKHLRLLASDET